MIQISAEDVKSLRERTGAGMMDCKKALQEAEGDYEKAIEFLKKKGQKISLARADKEASEGAVFTMVAKDCKSGVILVLSCETDFVAKTSAFCLLGAELVELALNSEVSSIADLMNLTKGGRNVAHMLSDLSGKVGEKIAITAFNRLSSDCVVAYNHAGNKVGVLVSFDDVQDVKNVGLDIAMQIAAMNPIAVGLADIEDSIVQKELEVAKEKAKTSGKPEAMLEKIAQGMVAKALEQYALLNQAFIKDHNITVEQHLKTELGGAKIRKFHRLNVG